MSNSGEVFSALSCSTCGWRHDLHAFEEGDQVEVSEVEDRGATRPDALGLRGVVTSIVRGWRTIFWVKVSVAPHGVFEFSPCELRHVA